MRFATIALFAACTACTTPTEIRNAWLDPNYRGPPMHHLLVIGSNMSETDRRTVEDTFVRTLATRGVRADPSYRIFPTGMPTKDEIRDVIERDRYDGMLVSTLRSVRERTSYIHDVGFYDYYGGGVWGYGYTTPVTDEYVNYETTLWTPDGRLIWSATTRTINPSSTRDFAESMVSRVVKALTRTGLVPAAREEEDEGTI